MTEKRFNMIITGADGSFYYHDNVTDERITSTLELENKLNELSDENEQLKYDNTALKGVFDSYRSQSEYHQKQLEKENDELKSRINSRLHYYRELSESTNDDIVKRVVEDLEDILR